MQSRSKYGILTLAAASMLMFQNCGQFFGLHNFQSAASSTGTTTTNADTTNDAAFLNTLQTIQSILNPVLVELGSQAPDLTAVSPSAYNAGTVTTSSTTTAQNNIIAELINNAGLITTLSPLQIATYSQMLTAGVQQLSSFPTNTLSTQAQLLQTTNVAILNELIKLINAAITADPDLGVDIPTTSSSSSSTGSTGSTSSTGSTGSTVSSGSTGSTGSSGSTGSTSSSGSTGSTSSSGSTGSTSSSGSTGSTSSSGSTGSTSSSGSTGSTSSSGSTASSSSSSGVTTTATPTPTPTPTPAPTPDPNDPSVPTAPTFVDKTANFEVVLAQVDSQLGQALGYFGIAPADAAAISRTAIDAGTVTAASVNTASANILKDVGNTGPTIQAVVAASTKATYKSQIMTAIAALQTFPPTSLSAQAQLVQAANVKMLNAVAAYMQ